VFLAGSLFIILASAPMAVKSLFPWNAAPSLHAGGRKLHHPVHCNDLWLEW
jgi:hypothetical protein